ncbi:ISL3 family transposase [Bacillus cereus group sp. TH204-1LC]|uniref:ISL3 family transposase n=1 Tax=Bacillus cereus group sp. TH204-1LC TaxID=3018054 RepID=UPI0022E04983|nr:ISL3 family transposase [Bacillus cereus group sp. TH204-1LC]MDA1620641.1 ISL3 family transposase [Bacillus cereus group sp. TH204-1LC]
MTTNMLNLPSFKILDMKESEYDYRFLVETTLPPPSYCPKCGTVANLYKHGKKEQLFFDLPMHAKRVGIFVKRQRYKCNECEATFFENLPDIDEGRSVTNRLINWIQEASLEKTFTSVAEEIGVDEKTVRNIFNDYVDELEAQTDFNTPKWLGIDEVHLLKNYRCVITDVENKSVIDILRKRNKDNVISYLSKLQDIDKIELVAMDMWNPYKSAVNTVIPHAKIVIDKFHVVKLANEALEKTRKANRQNVTAKERRQLMRDRYVLLTRSKDLTDFDDQIKLQVWTQNFPLLGQAYELKEQFFDIYEAKSINDAYKLYQNWISNVPKELMTYFEDLIRAMDNWEEEIFNYFNSPITNAYTESLNRLIKTMNHVGRGYSFEALRAKILFTQGYRKVKKKKKFKEVEVTFRKMLPDQFPNRSQIGYEWVYEEIYGAEFSTLSKAMEEGTF